MYRLKLNLALFGDGDAVFSQSPITFTQLSIISPGASPGLIQDTCVPFYPG
jgi:hypothetical protein